jgi:hypothetical protein
MHNFGAVYIPFLQCVMGQIDPFSGVLLIVVEAFHSVYFRAQKKHEVLDKNLHVLPVMLQVFAKISLTN